MDSRGFLDLQSRLNEIASNGLFEFIKSHKDDDCLSGLLPYIEDAERNSYKWDIEKIKAMLEIVKLQGGNTIEEILSFLGQSKYGWQDNRYHLYNSCLRHGNRCKRNRKIDNSPDATASVFADIDYIFLHRDYGGITSYLFCYSLAALFSSKLKSDYLRVPYFLQIACERNSNIYRLIHEIVDICDMNTGIFGSCELEPLLHGGCEYEHITLFPSQSSEKAIEDLMYHRDVAIVIDGYDNEKYYNSLLRDVANVPNKTRNLDTKDRFNVLPIFVCSTITAQYRNVISMDLTGMDVDVNYLDAIQDNKQRLASWVFELVQNAEERLFTSHYNTNEMRPNPRYELPFFNNINRHTNHIRIEYRRCEELSQADMTNIGLLSYFWEEYMRVFRRSIQLPDNTEFKYRGYSKPQCQRELVKRITGAVVESLITVHNIYSPQLSQSVAIAINEKSIDLQRAKQLKEKGEGYGRDIVKYYQSYGVSIRILPDAEYKDERYVFPVKMMPGTNASSISRYTDEVRRLLGVEFLTADIASSSMKLILSEKPLKENSLIRMLESQQFKENKMEIPYAVGYDMMGEMVIADVAEFPHLIIGGTTNSGKSSAIHCLLMSIVYKQPADKVKLLLLDFGSSRLNMFMNVPHMLIPSKIIRDASEGQQAMLLLQEEMEHRLKRLDSVDAKSYDVEYGKIPSIVCVLDEFPAFIQQSGSGRSSKKVSAIITDLLARARKVKIHLILSAQDTTQGGIEIKNTNLPAGIVFRCTSWPTSKTVIDASDATKLSGKGAMLFRCEQYEGIKRLQGSYMPPEEIMDMLDTIDFTKNSDGKKYDEVQFLLGASQGITQSGTPSITGNTRIAEDSDTRLLIEIVKWIRDDKKEKISNKQLKDKFEMGYDRANRFLQRLEDAGIISHQKKGAKLPRIVNLDKLEEFLNSHGYTGDAAEAISNQISDSSDIPTAVESSQDQDTESPDGISDTQPQPLPSTLPQSKPLKVNHDALRKNSIRNQFRKGRHN